jgi:alpha-L-rhamnosidase
VYLATRRLADIAEVLQRHDDAARYAQTAGEISLAFNRAFFDAASATYRSAPGEAYRQTSNVLPLAFGLVPADAIPAVVQHLVHDIVEVRDGHLNTGALGAKYLLPVLTEHGRADVAVTVASQRTCPSWGYWKEQGSRTLWEAWDPNARSHDHYFLGSVDRWLCEHVAGLRPSGPGFETIEVKPLVDQRITAASERYRSVRGEIAVAWQRSSAGLELDLTLPVGATALVHVPAGEGDLVTEAGRPIDASPSRGYASVSVASGSYHFQSTPGAASGSPVA